MSVAIFILSKVIAPSILPFLPYPHAPMCLLSMYDSSQLSDWLGASNSIEAADGGWDSPTQSRSCQRPRVLVYCGGWSRSAQPIRAHVFCSRPKTDRGRASPDPSSSLALEAGAAASASAGLWSLCALCDQSLSQLPLTQVVAASSFPLY